MVEKDIEEEVPKLIIELNNQVVVPTNLPTKFMPHPSLEFTVPQKEKSLTQMGHVLIQIDL